MRSCTATPHIPMLFTEWWYLRSEDGPAVVSTAATGHGPLEALPVSCNTRGTYKTDYMINSSSLKRNQIKLMDISYSFVAFIHSASKLSVWFSKKRSILIFSLGLLTIHLLKQQLTTPRCIVQRPATSPQLGWQCESCSFKKFTSSVYPCAGFEYMPLLFSLTHSANKGPTVTCC